MAEKMHTSSAGREIYEYLVAQDDLLPTRNLPDRQVPAFQAIIDKHRPPEEKVVEELLAAACYVAKGFVYVVCQNRNQDPNETDIYQSICAALAAYEKAKEKP